MAAGHTWRLTAPFVFAYFPGPRTKTPAENTYLASLPAHGNSMTLAPEVVLLAELGIPCAAVALPHKRSVPPQQDSAQLLNQQMDQLEPPHGPTQRMGPYVYVHSRASAGGGKSCTSAQELHNSSETAMRATLDGGKAVLSRLVLAWLLQQTKWAPPGQDPVKWYLQEMQGEAIKPEAAVDGR